MLSFSLEANPANIGICPGQSKNIIVNVNPILGYTQAVTLSLPGLPSGFSASFGVNPVIPGNTTVLTITNNSAPVGTTNQTLNGVSGSINKNISLVLISNNGLSLGLPSLTVPANNSINQNIRPAFSWTPLANASLYDVQITRSSNFSEVIFNIENIAATSLTFSGYLDGYGIFLEGKRKMIVLQVIGLHLLHLQQNLVIIILQLICLSYSKFRGTNYKFLQVN